MKRFTVVLAVCLYAVFGIRHSACAQVPQLINYQGRLLDGTNLVNGLVGLTLRLYNAPAAGTLVYADSNQVTVADGLYATQIGDGTVAGDLDLALTNAQVWLEAEVNGTVLTPRERWVAVAYARRTHGLHISATHGLVVLPQQGTNSLADSARHTVIGGGTGNTVGDSWQAVLDGGEANQIGDVSDNSVIGGGAFNTLGDNVHYGVIGGGYSNIIAVDADHAVIGGGRLNYMDVDARNSAIGGGNLNRVDGEAAAAVIAGGESNRIGQQATHAVIGGGGWNTIGSFMGRGAVIGGGHSNQISQSSFSVIGGGLHHRINDFSWESVVDGGRSNVIEGNSQWSAIGGGAFNTVAFNAHGAVVGGGTLNLIGTNADYSAIGGGSHNRVGEKSERSVIAGGLEHEVGTNSVWSTIGGGFSNAVRANSAACTIAGGRNNRIGQDSEYATVGGGLFNWIEDIHTYALIAGGVGHLIGSNGRAGVISGGQQNEIQALVTNATIAGGAEHLITTGAHHAVISGGMSNRVSGRYGTIPGGDQNLATNYAFAAGQRAKARHGGAFVWGDQTAADVASTNANSVTFRAGGGYRLFSDASLTLGAQLAPNASAWAAVSDRNAKQNFAPIDTAAILDQVAQLPLSAWTYKQDPEQRRYIGPMAQDFHAAFDLGNETTINTLDADGVALAAIQALAAESARLRQEATAWQGRQRTEDRGRQEQIDALSIENAALKQQLDEVLHRLRALEAR